MDENKIMSIAGRISRTKLEIYVCIDVRGQFVPFLSLYAYTMMEFAVMQYY
jgi:hypothetical protein